MVKCKSIYLKKILTGFSVTMPIIVLLSTLSIYLIARNSISSNHIIIELKPDTSIDSDYPVYRVGPITYSSENIVATLNLESQGNQLFGVNLHPLRLEAVFVDKDIIRIIIRDAAKKQWMVDDFNFTTKYSINLYDFSISQYPFSFQIKRKSDGYPVFDTAGMGFYFSERYLEIETIAQEGRYVLGLGERKGNIVLEEKERNFSMWPNSASPGHHPFYVELGAKGAHGVFMHNFNAMEIQNSKKSVKFRAVGGIIDLFVFLGNNGEEVVRNFHKTIGLPELPPFWSLGYFIGKKGLNKTEDVLSLVQKYENKSFPLDGVFINDDYLEIEESFEVGEKYENAKAMIDQLHSKNKYFIAEVKSAITIDSWAGRQAMSSLLPLGVNSSLGLASYIDWYSPEALTDWHNLLNNLTSKIPLDGFWLTENSISSYHRVDKDSMALLFTPKQMVLENGTLPLKTVHHNNFKEIDLHSLWGSQQVIATRSFNEILRPFIISENTRPGIKAHHLFQQVSASWDDYRSSIFSVAAFDIFGIRSGASVCGTTGVIANELCTRWHQLGVFYPFFAHYRSEADDLGWPSTIEKDVKKSIYTRYALSMYIYSLFFETSLHGGSIFRPMVMEFYDDTMKNYPGQTMLGGALLGIFALYSSNQLMTIYLPSPRWFNLKNGEIYPNKGIQSIDAGSDGLILLRAGYIIPYQTVNSETSIQEMRQKNIEIIVALDESSSAKGVFYVDDGFSSNSIRNKKFTKIICTAEHKERLVLTFRSVVKGYVDEYKQITLVKVFGVKKPTLVRIDKDDAKFSYEQNVLKIFIEVSTFSTTEISIYL
ncbi:hypothetical protein SteCoe_18421 [Stentor coeruleus]|uniref:Uncharacterized protein n=1 Tax=Stentor coeruleus TaxID=5963 RepID=A0A1R2BX34_9CILI|nr:hypothetical protein SteCoe_18421 [Stentor coeruleus]